MKDTQCCSGLNASVYIVPCNVLQGPTSNGNRVVPSSNGNRDPNVVTAIKDIGRFLRNNTS